MSRYYEALQEASRSGRASNRNPEETELNAVLAVNDFQAEDSSEGKSGVEPEVDDLGPLVEESPSANFPTAADLPADPLWTTSTAEDSYCGFMPLQRPSARKKMPLDRQALIPNSVDPIVVEHYRRLRTKIMQQHTAKPFRSLLVTSPEPEEGKSVTVLNLAFSFAMLRSFKVLVVDGDLRRGSLGRWLGMEDHAGFGNVIDGSATFAQVVLKWDEVPVHFVLAGNSKIPAAELLHPAQVGRHLRTITQQFDLVLIDSPPVNVITDTQLLSESCDAVMLVVRAFATTRKALEKAAKDLHACRIIGTILNGGSRAGLYGRYKGY
jgi:protein-tyrosine kinase